MRKFVILPFLFVLFIGLVIPVTYAEVLEKGYNDFQGTIDQQKIQMSIYSRGAIIVGSYFYERDREEISLHGTITGQDIVLYEFDANGSATGVFKGTLGTDDHYIGTWSSLTRHCTYHFNLEIKSIIFAEYGRRYKIASAGSDEQVERFVKDLQTDVKNDEKLKIAALVNYPIAAQVNGIMVTINNQDEFVKDYDGIFNTEFKNIIANAFTKYMFVNYQGIMFGENMKNVWIYGIQGGPKIYSIAN